MGYDQKMLESKPNRRLAQLGNHGLDWEYEFDRVDQVKMGRKVNMVKMGW